jgi:hypothetical protein
MILPPHLLQLTKLFHLGFNFITADNIPEPNWRTNRKYPLNQGEFVKLYTDALSLLGVSFGNKTRYVMLDIDIDSPYHPRNNPQAYARLLATLEQIELVSPVPIRSSHSGGIHIYYFFPRPVSTFRLAALIRVTLINAKFLIKNGQIEIFPNTKAYSEDRKKPSYYKAHRLPLQPDSGACLLDQWGDELICVANLTHEGQLGMFLAAADKSAAANDIQWIESKFAWAYELFKKHIAKYQHHSSNYSEVAQDWKENLELSFEIGWTDYHQTNDILPLFVCYGIVFEGLEDKQELFDWAYQKILITSGYHEYCRHQHEIERKIWDWINSTIDNQYYIKYCGFPPRCGITPHQLVARLNPNTAGINPYNQNLVERTKQRLNDILTALEVLPQKIGERLLVIQSKCRELFGEGISRNTLYKNDYKQIWAGSGKEGEILKNTIPPTPLTQTVVVTEFPTISAEINRENEIQQSQSVIDLSHTPALYEALIAEILPPSNFIAPEASVPPVLETFLDLSNENLFTPLNQPELELKSDLHFLDITIELCDEPIETVLATETYRSVVDVARDVRANMVAIDDELLREFLGHPQCAAIELTIELADKLVAARTPNLIQAMVADLSPCQKMDMWRVLKVEERAGVQALMAAPAPPSLERTIPQSGGFANEKKEPILTKGAVVRTLTGLYGVIRHVFQSVAKPFVVHHAEIGRTILYGIEELRLAD